MRIFTDNLKLIQKVWSQIKNRDSKYYEYVLLDFKEGCLGFENRQTVVKVKLHLEDNDGKGFSHRNLFIDGAKFFSLVQFYDYIDIDENDIFYSSLGDKFQIPRIEEDIALTDVSFNDWEKYTVDFTPELNTELTASFSYVDTEPDSTYSALFAYDGKLIACNRFRIFICKTDGSISSKAEMSLPLPLLKLINTIRMSGKVTFLYRIDSNEAPMVEFSYNDIWMRYGGSSDFALPFEPDSEDFKSAYDHPNYFVVSLSELNEAINILSAYYTDVSDAICTLSFDTSNPEDRKMIIKVSYEQSGNIEYRIGVSSCTDDEYFNGKTVAIYITFLRNAISTLSQFGVENMMITYDEDAPAMAFYDAKEEAPAFVIHTITEEI